MRIYDLAKDIGQKLSIDVKPAKLAEEFKTMPQFAVIHDTIRSHASSVDDEHADQMVRIYMERYSRKAQPEKNTAPAPAPAAHAVRPAAPHPVRPQPTAPPVAPRPPLPPVRPAAPPRPQPIHPPLGQRPAPPIPAVHRPAPIQPPGGKPAAPPPHVPETPVAPVAPVAHVAPSPAAPVAPPAAPPAAAPRAQATPVAEAPAHPAAAKPVQATAVLPTVVQPGQLPPASPAAPAAARPAGAPQAPVAPKPAQPVATRPPEEHRRPQQPAHGQAPQGAQRGGNVPKGQKFRPTGLASELKSSSGTTGITAGPDLDKSVQPRAGAERAAGQPTAPAMPKFSMDSPFVKPPTPPRRPEPRQDRPSGDRGPRPEYQDRGPRSGGDRPGGGGGYDRGPRPEYQDRGPRPGGDRPGGGGGYDRGPRPEYQDRGPRPAGDRPQGDRGPRPEYQDRGPRPAGGGYDRGPRPAGDRPVGDRGPRPAGGGYDRGPRPGGDRPTGDRGPRPAGGGYDRGPRPGAKKGDDAPLELTTVPEIGVMKLKPAKRRHGEKGREKGEGEGAAKPGVKGKPGVKPGLKGPSKVVLKPSKIYGDADEFRRPLKAPARKFRPTALPDRRPEPIPKAVGPVILTGPLTVGAFAEKLSVSPSELIKRSFMKGKAITINQLINFELAEELAFDMEIDLQVQLESEETDIAAFRQYEDQEADLQPRPPVVTIMGHVDHGKTTLLDYYRRSQVVEGEFGGITQHIGAYHVTTSRGDIVFLDTPGHEAFTSMRARGAQCTDIVVLVVSADDGVMPQTIEAINHAKAAGVPIIVAINKIDLPQANPERVRTELLQYSVVPTSLGGDVEFVEISAKKGVNMDTLLEIISLQAEVMELKANPDRPAEGVVIESHVDPLRGAVATILVQKGTLKVGQIFVVGQESGRVRAMLDDHGRPMTVATPGTPCELVGLSGSPDVGEVFLVMDDERKAREIAERREQRRRLLDLGTTRHVTLEGLHDMISEGKIKELNVILKADVQGSVEAISQSLEKMAAQEIRVRMLHSGTGSITESDVNLAMASSAVIIGFNIRPEQGAAELADREGVEIKHYRIIYELLADIEKAMLGMLDKKFSEQAQGRTEVREIFRVTKVGTVAGCYVLTGEIQRNALCRLVRDGKVVYSGKVASLRRVKDDVAKVAAGFECGVMLEKFADVKEGDIIETYTLKEMEAELTRQA